MFLNFLAATSLLFYYINVPVVDMREQPTSNSEMASQAFFSEQIEPLEEKEDWVKIETKIDHYQGWVKKGCFCQRESEFLPTVMVNRLAAHLYHIEDTVYGPMLTLPYESRLEVIEPKEDPESRWIKVALPDQRVAYVQRGDVISNSQPLTCQEMCALSYRFLNLPYTYGGRCSFGYDCSGLVQMLYRQRGIHIPRDSKQQVNWEGFKPVSTKDLQPGDLIFFGLDENRIRHVGMYLGNESGYPLFIHTSAAIGNQPYVQLTSLDHPLWGESGHYPYKTARTLVKP